MASNKLMRFGPFSITNSSTCFLNPTITSTAGSTGLGTISQPYLIVRHLRFVNSSASAITFTGYVDTTSTGATLAKTVIGNSLSIAGNSYHDWYGALRLDSADFLNFIAGTTNVIIVTGEGEIGISG